MLLRRLYSTTNETSLLIILAQTFGAAADPSHELAADARTLIRELALELSTDLSNSYNMYSAASSEVNLEIFFLRKLYSYF